MEIKVDKVVNCIGDNCPLPLIKTREAIMKAKEGEIIKVVGTHPESYEEIPLALEGLGLKILERKKEGNEWEIVFKVIKKIKENKLTPPE